MNFYITLQNMCFGNVEGESCGWPAGTVRACIALITIPLGFVASVSIMIILIVKEQYTIALGVNSVIWAAIGTIIGHYFGSKQAEGAAKIVAKSEHELIESRNMEIANTTLFQRQPYTPIPPINDNELNNDVVISL